MVRRHDPVAETQEDLVAALIQPAHEPAERHRLHCSFCGKSETQVRFLAAGKSGGMICNTCCLKSVFIFLRAYAASVFGGK
ncbi:MAG: hypothetical protein JO058_19490 [Alphaproteobacteria bacterium]|nr:hypothetical protein [Alphaproteobacteria bacterium]